LLILLLLSACASLERTPSAIPTIGLGSTPIDSLPGSNLAGGVTASGVVVPDQEASLAFQVGGVVERIQADPGDLVKANQLLIQLDDTLQNIQLQRATLALILLTSPEAVASARMAVAQDQQELHNAEVAQRNLTGQYSNEGLINNARAELVLAEEALNDSQENYDTTPGDPEKDTYKALAYQKLYAAQKNYEHAEYMYNLVSGKANQYQLDESAARVAYAKARLADDQALLAILTGGQAPADASGTGYTQLLEARLAVQSAQAALDSTRLLAPFDGQVAWLYTAVGEFASPGQVLLTMSDISHFHIETIDLSERDVPRVKMGQAVTIKIKPLERDVPGKVEWISPLAESLGGDVVYRVGIRFDDPPPGLRAGMSVDLLFALTP